MRRQKHQSGFSIVEAVLIVAVIGVIGAAGWFVYQHNRVKPTSAATGTNQPTNSQPSTTTPTPTTYLRIKEWGVRLPIDNTIASLYYYINPQNPDVAYLSLKTVSDIAPDCAADKVSLGSIFRQTSAQHQDAVNRNQPGFYAIGSLQIGDYWYGFSKPNAGCGDGTAAQQQAIDKAQQNYDLRNTFKALEADPSTN